MPSVMNDSREPVPTTLGFAISRWGRPGELAATGAAGEEDCGGRERSGTRVRLRVRLIVPGPSPVIRRMSPQRHLPMPMLLGCS